MREHEACRLHARPLAALDAQPDSRLPISLDSLNHANDRRLIGLDLAWVYLRWADPGTIAPALAPDIVRFRHASDTLHGWVLLGGGLSYRRQSTGMRVLLIAVLTADTLSLLFVLFILFLPASSG